jgi:hypothetical protein
MMKSAAIAIAHVVAKAKVLLQLQQASEKKDGD